jgi:hypothetical protein
MDPYPKRPNGDAQKIGTGEGKKLTLEQLKATGEQVTLEQLVEAVAEENKDGGNWQEFHIDELMVYLEYEVQIGRIQQLGPKLYRFVPEHPLNQQLGPMLYRFVPEHPLNNY